MMHQGTSIIPAEFILVAKADHNLQGHQTKLLANGIAQTSALLTGQSLQEVIDMDCESESSEQEAAAKVFTGERPSTTILLQELNPYSLGVLLAFYEHKTFCGGLITNINSFDQMGVELGKRLASQVENLLNTPGSGVGETSLDPSTIVLINKLLSK
jgi:glucose-6-phosphate isomerase